MPAIYLKQWREFAGYSQKEIAIIMGVSEATISRIETGMYDFNGKYLDLFGKALSIDPILPITRPPDDLRIRGRQIPHSLIREKADEILTTLYPQGRRR